jgi:hypothetical protein
VRLLRASAVQHPGFMGIHAQDKHGFTGLYNLPTAPAAMGMGSPPSRMLVGPFEKFLYRLHVSIVAEYSAIVNCTHVYNSLN